MSKTPTDELPVADVYDIGEIRKRLLEVVERLTHVDAEIAEVGRLGLTLTRIADKLEQLSKNLTPPDLHEVFAELDAPYAIPNARFLAQKLTEAIILVTQLMPDAEITGSLETHENARAWLESMGILVT